MRAKTTNTQPRAIRDTKHYTHRPSMKTWVRTHADNGTKTSTNTCTKRDTPGHETRFADSQRWHTDTAERGDFLTSQLCKGWSPKCADLRHTKWLAPSGKQSSTSMTRPMACLACCLARSTHVGGVANPNGPTATAAPHTKPGGWGIKQVHGCVCVQSWHPTARISIRPRPASFEATQRFA